jgi:hypothetical protein
MKLTFTQWQNSLPGSTLLLLAFLVCFGWTNTEVSGQTCTYTIQMTDDFGDGWNGGFLTVTSNGVVTTHTLATGSTGMSTFQVTDGKPITIVWTPGAFAYEPGFTLVNASGNSLYTNGTADIPVGLVYSAIACCSTGCNSPNGQLTVVNQITDTSAHINWLGIPGADGYIVEYGPTGFPYGSGAIMEITDSEITLTGLNSCVTYQAYISTICDPGNVSCPLGPISFAPSCPMPSLGPDSCTYKLELFNAVNFGWNGSSVTVSWPGFTNTYTFFSGMEAFFDLKIPSNAVVNISYQAGFNEVGHFYDILDPNGSVIFSSTVPPKTGNSFSFIACADCPRPLNKFMKDVNADNATVQWVKYPGSTGNYNIEYGPVGFTWGTGTTAFVTPPANTFKMTGLQENTAYDVYVRHACNDTTFSLPQNPLTFKTLWYNDVGVSGIVKPDAGTACNLSENETVTVLLRNYGQKPQTLFEFYFAVNGEVAPIPVPQDGLFTGVVGNDSTQVISFETTWDFSVPGFYVIEAWTSLEGDSNPANDTFRVEIVTAFPKPVKENFEDNAVAPGWVHDGTIYAPNNHNNPTYVIADNLFSGDQTFTLTTNRVGPVAEGDSLYFDYRYVNWSAGTTATTLGANDKLEVQISTDCEETFQTVLTINSANHVTATTFAKKVVLLDDYAGEAINVRFRGTWGSGDYWLDLDNINMTGCPESLQLVGNVKGSVEGDSTGSIDLSAYLAQGPLTVTWTNAAGDTVSTVEDPVGLPVGIYTAHVTDVNGCQDSKEFEIGIFVGADEVEGVEQISLYPNPASGRAFLDVKLTERMDLRVRLFNMNGQAVYESEQSSADYLRQELDLTNQTPGMYIVQIVAGGKPYYTKLIVNR